MADAVALRKLVHAIIFLGISTLTLFIPTYELFGFWAMVLSGGIWGYVNFMMATYFKRQELW